MSTRTSRVVKGSLTGVLQFGVQIVLQALLAPLLLAYSGQEALGAYAAISQAVVYMALVDLGFGVTLNRFLARAWAAETADDQFARVLTNGRLVFLVSNLAYAGLLLVLRAHVVGLFALDTELAREAQRGLLLLAVWVVVRTPLAVYGAALISTQNLAANNIVLMVGTAVRLVVALGLIVAGFGITGLMAATVAAELVVVVLQRRLFRRRVTRVLVSWRLPSGDLLREMMGYGGLTFLLTLGSRLTYATDQIIVGSMFGAGVASVYYVTQLPAFIAFNIVFRLVGSAEPGLVELNTRHGPQSTRDVYVRLHRYTLLASAPLAIGYAVLGQQLITLWVGREQFAGYPMLLALAAFIVTITFGNVDYVFLLTAGDLRPLTWIVLVEGLVNVGVSIALAQAIGVEGVMIATTLVTIPRILYQNHRVRRRLLIDGTTFARTLIVTSGTPAVVGSLVLLALVWTTRPEAWPVVVSVAVAFLAAYAGATVWRGVTGDERQRLLAAANACLPRR